MIGTVYGQPASNGTVRTSLELVDIGSLDGAARGAAEAVQARQGADLGEKAVYLCHGFCEIGALDAPFPTLGQMIESGRRVFVMAVVDTLNGVGDWPRSHAQKLRLTETSAIAFAGLWSAWGSKVAG